MSKGQQKARDPVCGMEVAPGQHARVHLQMEFAFCSEQCRARFLAHPHLYIGYPGGSEISAHRPTFTFLGACRAWAIVASKVRERGQFFDRLREERSEGWSRSYLTKRIEKMDRSPTGAVDQPQVRQAPRQRQCREALSEGSRRQRCELTNRDRIEGLAPGTSQHKARAIRRAIRDTHKNK